MTPHKFIPPKDSEEDFNWETDRMIEEKLEYGYPDDEDIHDWDDTDDADDLKFVL